MVPLRQDKMGIWFLGKYTSFQCPLPTEGPWDLIFFYEALGPLLSTQHFGWPWAQNMAAIGWRSTVTRSTQSTCSCLCVLNWLSNYILMSSVDFTLSMLIATKVYFVKMWWGQPKNDTHHPFVQTASTATLDHGMAHFYEHSILHLHNSRKVVSHGSLSWIDNEYKFLLPTRKADTILRAIRSTLHASLMHLIPSSSWNIMSTCVIACSLCTHNCGFATTALCWCAPGFFVTWVHSTPLISQASQCMQVVWSSDVFKRYIQKNVIVLHMLILR